MKSRWSLLLALTVLMVGFMAQSASAQRFGSRTNSLVGLAATEAVQKHLGLDNEAASKLSALNDKYREASQKELTAAGIDYSAFSDLPAAERAMELRKAAEKTAEVSRKLAAAYLPKLAEVLSPDQIFRLKQIQLQASGIEVWLEPENVKELDLNDEQRGKLTELRNDYNRRQQQLDGDFQQRFAKIREMNVERDAKALALLSAAQKTKLEELQGAPFDVSQLGFGRRRGNN